MEHSALCFLLAICLVLTALHGASGACQTALLERQQYEECLPPMLPTIKRLDCSREGIDAATTWPNGNTYFFKNDFYWRLNGSHLVPGYPRLISQDWVGLPGNLDAALTWDDGRTFFFKGKQYWSFRGKRMHAGYPKNIRDGFCGIPDNIDAALLWKKNNKAYFFQGDKYWRFEGGDASEPVLKTYPKNINPDWKDIPTNLDAAVQWSNGRSYFFKGGNYYRYDDNGNDKKAGVPIEIDKNWGLKCTELNKRISEALNPAGLTSLPSSLVPTLLCSTLL